jgi:DNA-binding MarR family transcriptional regulator
MVKQDLSENEFIVLNYLDTYKSVTDISSLQEATGLESHEVESLLQGFETRGYVRKIVNNGTYWEITPDGENVVSAHRQFILSQVKQKDATIKLFEDFENLNIKFKELVTMWQVKNVEGVFVINDHTDPEYDAKILNELFTLHNDVVEIVGRIAKEFPRFKRYINRLEHAIEKLKSGEHDYIVTNPKSYHNVWYELHEDILKLWGKERKE